MRDGTRRTAAGRLYAAAYAAHYTEHDLPVALRLYMKVVALHPSDQAANHACAQIQSIVNSVVPKKDLLYAQIKLALARLGQTGFPDAKQVPVRQLASALSM